MYIMLFVNVKSFCPYPNKYKRIYIEEIKIKTLELFFTLDNVVDNRITQIQVYITVFPLLKYIRTKEKSLQKIVFRRPFLVHFVCF